MRRAALLAGVALAVVPGLSWAQSSPGLQRGQNPTSDQWNGYFAGKIDTANIGVTVAPLVGGQVPSQYLPAQPVTVLTGADPTGVLDSAPIIRAAMASNRSLVIPPGTYRLASTVSPPCCAYDPAAVYVHGLSNFSITAYGATFVVDPSIALSSAWHFDSDKNFAVGGLYVQGSRSGLTASQENVAFSFTSDLNFHASDLHAAPGFGGNGAALAGDWLVNGLFQNITMDGVGHCEDLAFLRGVTFLTQRAIGADTNGNEGTGQVGQTCFSVINDVPNAATNNTGVAFSETDGVNVLDTNEANFTTGFAVSSGLHYHFAGNDWHDNPGLSPSPGLGGYIFYTNGGVATSVGVPPGGISISDTFANNGKAVSGYGVGMSAGAIANSDVIAGVTFAGSTFDNNTAIGIGTDGSTGFSDINVSGDNNFTGSAQTTPINSALQAVLQSYRLPGGPQTFATVRLGGLAASGNIGVLTDNENQTFKPLLFGTFNEQNVASEIANGTSALAQVDGFQNPGQMSIATQLGSVAHYTQNASAPPLATDTGGTYTATTYTFATPMTAAEVTTLQQMLANNAARVYPPTGAQGYPVGPIITLGAYTGIAGTGYYRGNITAVAANGASLTVGGWYAIGNSAAGQVPPAGLAAAVNPQEHIWNNNGVITITPGVGAQSGTYDEADLYNNAPSGQLIGFSANCGGTSACSQGFIALGNNAYGFEAIVPVADGTNPFAIQNSTNGDYTYAVQANGSAFFGDEATADGITMQTAAAGGTPLINFTGVDGTVTARINVKGGGPLNLTEPVNVTGTMTASGGSIATPPAAVTATSGNSSTLVNNALNVFSGSGTLASYTLTLPTSPAQGTTVAFVFNVAVTALTLSAAQGINGNVGSVAAETPKAFEYVGGSWWPAP